MKFLLIASYPDSILSFRGRLLEELVCRGARVYIVSPRLEKNSQIRLELEARGFTVYNIFMNRTGVNPFSDLFTLISLYFAMIKIQPTHVLAYTAKPVIYGMIAARLSRIKNKFALVTGLGFSFETPTEGKPQYRYLVARAVAVKLYKIALKSASKVFFQNPDDCCCVKDLGVLSSEVPAVIVNGSGVDLGKYSVALPPSSLSFLMIARFLGSKGVREYAQAAKIVREIRPDICFKLVGWVDENPDSISIGELKEWIDNGTVNYLGKLEDVRPSITDCSVYVLPSYREGTPRTVLEAMSMGRPIITTDVPGCRETVVDGENGCLVEVKSVSSLVNAMMKFANDPSLISRMAKRSREIAEQKYDVKKVNRVMLKEMGLDS